MLRKYLNVIAKICRGLHPRGCPGRTFKLVNGRLMTWLCVLALSASAGAACAGSDEYIEYSGTASSRYMQDLLYREHHTLRYRDGRLIERTVLYTCANGSAFARKRVTYVDDQAPDFFFDDASNGMREGARSEGAARTMFFKADHTAVEKSAQLPRLSGVVVDAGFDNFVPAHWDGLMRGAPVPLPFLVISRLQVMNFEVQRLHAGRFDGRPTEVFRMKPAGILGLLFSGIDVTYDAADHRLVRYDGLTDVRDASGDNLQANIEFHAGDRKPSSAEAMASAQAAPLAACR
jgi:hypothetical protein